MKNKLSVSAIILIILVAITACTGGHPLHKMRNVLSGQHNKPINSHVYYRNRVVILLYHNFKNIECGTAITPTRFKQHLDMLQAEGFNVVSLQDVILFLNHKRTLPPNAVAITMDDGHRSNYTVAFKELKKRHWPGAIFVVVKNIEDAGSNNKGNWLTWDQLREMSRDNIAILSHSFNGHRFVRGQYPDGDAWFTTLLPGESKADYQERIYQDLLKARLVMQGKLDMPVESFALPFGMYNREVISMAHKAGHKYIWTTVPEALTSASLPEELPRISVGRKNTTARQLHTLIIAAGQR